jgi:hypothetical protein
MTSLWTLLDGLPLGPVLLFAVGWLAFLATVLAYLRSRRTEETCDRCGATWQRTKRGHQIHFCVQACDAAWWRDNEAGILKTLKDKGPIA